MFQILVVEDDVDYLLYKLITSPNRIFTRRQIMDDVWGPDNETDPHTLDVHISRLWERFFAWKISQGNGLGLALAKRIVDLHDGNITISSKEGKGSTVIVSLPLQKNIT